MFLYNFVWYASRGIIYVPWTHYPFIITWVMSISNVNWLNSYLLPKWSNGSVLTSTRSYQRLLNLCLLFLHLTYRSSNLAWSDDFVQLWSLPFENSLNQFSTLFFCHAWRYLFDNWYKVFSGRVSDHVQILFPFDDFVQSYGPWP